jgi:hypothetical protein
MSRVHPKILLVEGKEDLRFVPEIIEANGVKWEKPYPVFIDDLDGYENFVKPDEIATYLKSSGLEIIGLMIDADDNLNDRWKSQYPHLAVLARSTGPTTPPGSQGANLGSQTPQSPDFC